MSSMYRVCAGAISSYSARVGMEGTAADFFCSTLCT